MPGGSTPPSAAFAQHPRRERSEPGGASPDSLIPDPFSPQSLNRYGYVLNNPLRYTDPTGHRACDDMDAGGRCVTAPPASRGPSKTTPKPASTTTRTPGSLLSPELALQSQYPNNASTRIETWNEVSSQLGSFIEEEVIAMTAYAEVGTLFNTPRYRSILLQAATNRYVMNCGLNKCSELELLNFLVYYQAWGGQGIDEMLSEDWRPYTSDVPLAGMTSEVVPVDVPTDWGNPFAGSAEYARLTAMFPGTSGRWFYLGPEWDVWAAYRRPAVRQDMPELGDPVWFIIVSQERMATFCAPGNSTCME